MHRPLRADRHGAAARAGRRVPPRLARRASLPTRIWHGARAWEALPRCCRDLEACTPSLPRIGRSAVEKMAWRRRSTRGSVPGPIPRLAVQGVLSHPHPKAPELERSLTELARRVYKERGRCSRSHFRDICWITRPPEAHDLLLTQSGISVQPTHALFERVMHTRTRRRRSHAPTRPRLPLA